MQSTLLRQSEAYGAIDAEQGGNEADDADADGAWFTRRDTGTLDTFCRWTLRTATLLSGIESMAPLPGGGTSRDKVSRKIIRAVIAIAVLLDVGAYIALFFHSRDPRALAAAVLQSVMEPMVILLVWRLARANSLAVWVPESTTQPEAAMAYAAPEVPSGATREPHKRSAGGARASNSMPAPPIRSWDDLSAPVPANAAAVHAVQALPTAAAVLLSLALWVPLVLLVFALIPMFALPIPPIPRKFSLYHVAAIARTGLYWFAFPLPFIAAAALFCVRSLAVARRLRATVAVVPGRPTADVEAVVAHGQACTQRALLRPLAPLLYLMLAMIVLQLAAISATFINAKEAEDERYQWFTQLTLLSVAIIFTTPSLLALFCLAEVTDAWFTLLPALHEGPHRGEGLRLALAMRLSAQVQRGALGVSVAGLVISRAMLIKVLSIALTLTGVMLRL